MLSLPSPLIMGLILAGGRGSRMGGQDKGLLQFAGQSLALRVRDVLRVQTELVLVSANRHTEDYEAMGLPVVRDRLPDYQGPLSGIEAGLKAAPTPYVFVVPCDAPFLDGSLMTRLYERMEATQANVVYAQSQDPDGRWHAEPLFALIRSSMATRLSQFLDSGQRKVLDWYTQIEHATIDVDDALSFANANTPEEFARYEAAAKTRS